MKLLICERSSASQLESEGAAPLVASIFYGDRSAAGRAVDLINRVGVNFSGGLQIDMQLWSFDVLRLDDVIEQATVTTANADLIIVAARHECELPREVKQCIEQALMLRGAEEVAVVALVNDAHPQIPSPLCDYLTKLCHSTTGHFFSAENLPLDACRLTPERIHERAEAHSSVLDRIMHRQLPRLE